MMAMELSLTEWKSLGVGNISMMSNNLNKIDMLKLADVDEINKWWVETIIPRLKAWATESEILMKAASQAQPAAQPAPTINVIDTAYTDPIIEGNPVINGAAPPVNKGGWPKGRKRTPKPTNSAAALPPVTQ